VNAGDRRRQIEDLCHAALEQDPAARAAFLARVCGTDDSLRRELDALLAHAQTAEGFLATPIEALAANALTTAGVIPLIGRSLGACQLSALLGSGGMGEVYRARDMKLGRDVAVKILPSVFTSDPERLARFEREARVLATLNHPNIGAIYGLEAADGLRGLILELVEGETLADRLNRRPMPIKEALGVARQIAEALEAAHEKGIIHRDLKPANVKVDPNGVVKVLDFGLAKLDDSRAGAEQLLDLPTISNGRTKEGVILGTAAYMSPEQARGQPVDKRTDLWAFGCVLYEMLAGVPAFARSTVTDTLAAIVDQEVNWDALPPATPRAAVKLLRWCLAKDRRQRLADAADARLALEDVLTDPSGEMTATRSVSFVHVIRSWRGTVLVVGVATIAAVGTAVWVSRGSRRLPPPPQVTRLTLPLVEGHRFLAPSLHQIAISPDGSKIVYAGNGRLYLRSLGDVEARAIPGTDVGALAPEFSPDGLSIAFHAESDRTFKRIGLTGGVATTVYGSVGEGMSWDPGGITFVGVISGTRDEDGILRVSPNGGQPEVLVRGDKNYRLSGRPEVLNGEVVLFSRENRKDFEDDRWEESAEIVAQSIRTGERRVLVTGGSDPRYLPTGHLVYAVEGSLHAVRFDVARLTVVGSPTLVIEGVRRGPVTRTTAHYSVSASGSLIYLPGRVRTTGNYGGFILAEVNRNGQVTPRLGPGPYESPRYSPDGRQVVFELAAPRPRQIGIYDLSGAVAVRPLTFGGANQYPLWHPDGRRVTFQSDREGDLGVFWQRADGTGPAERLTKPESGTGHEPNAWSPNGQTLLYEVVQGGRPSISGSNRFSLWVLSLRDRKVERFGAVESPWKINATFAPDGQWVAYGTGAGAAARVYVEPFPRTGNRYTVANEPARHPFWSPDGKELFYASGMDSFRVVTFSTQPTVTFGNPVVVPRGGLFEYGIGQGGRLWDLSPDGKRILGIIAAQTTQQALAPTMQVVLNWQEELKAKMP
jgi:serine/threonine-protein kinase